MKKVVILFLVVSMLAVFLVGTTGASDNPLQRVTKFGVIEGYPDNSNMVWVWKRVPYAKPPVGDLRWQAPQDPDYWQGVLETKEDCEKCTQLKRSPGWISFPEVWGSEDCLYLNIYRPQSDEKNLPVYLWIHGGANVAGFASNYPMENLARQANMVVVVMQYRLNVFGFFTHAALRSYNDKVSSSGNFGLLDQIQALKWLQENIAAFGGNPYNITIAGQSAGGHNVAGLMISPLARGLFQRAVMHSGGMKSQSVASTDEIAKKTIENALIMKGKAKNANDAKTRRAIMTKNQIAEFMRGLSNVELLTAHAGGPGKASVALGNHIEDGYVIPGNLLCTIESGNYNKVPLMLGSVEFESGSINTLLPSLKKGMPNFIDLLKVVQGKMRLEEVLPDDGAKKIWKTTRYYNSRFWRSAFVDELARRVKAYQDDVYAYQFNWGNEDVRPGPKGFIYGACHSQDIPFWHANAAVEPFRGSKYYMYEDTARNRPGRKALNDVMVAYLAQFARTGNPNGDLPGLPVWQPWSNEKGGPKVIFLDADLHVAQLKMDNEEVSMASVRKALDIEDAATQGWVRLMIKVIQRYADYTPGNYVYNKCGSRVYQ